MAGYCSEFFCRAIDDLQDVFLSDVGCEKFCIKWSDHEIACLLPYANAIHILSTRYHVKGLPAKVITEKDADSVVLALNRLSYKDAAMIIAEGLDVDVPVNTQLASHIKWLKAGAKGARQDQMPEARPEA